MNKAALAKANIKRTAVIGLGSNIGDALATLQKAVDTLSLTLRNPKISRPVKSAPMYNTDQPWFVNAILIGEAVMDPLDLLALLKDIERNLGRKQRTRNGPREVDLDLVAYGDLNGQFGNLVLPHPRIAERRFVLAPWAEVDPEFSIPGLGSVAELLAQTVDQAPDVLVIEDAAFSLSSYR